MFTAAFWQDALERAVKTAAQFDVVIIGGTALANPLLLMTLNWGMIVQATVLGFLASILTSLASSLVGKSNSASLVK